MPPRRQKPDYYDLLDHDREQQMDAMARALAAEQGQASGTKHTTTAEEDYLYHWQDPLVTPDHLAMIAQQTAEKLGQEKTPQGAPMWTTDQINTEIRAQQQRAVTPKRFDLIETGRPDVQQQWAYAGRLAARHSPDGTCPTCQTPAEPTMPGDGQDMPTMAMQSQMAGAEGG